MWDAYLGLESYMELRTPFQPLEHFIANGGAPAIAPRAPVSLPQNAPAALVNEVWKQAGQIALQALSQPGIEVPFEVINSIIESPRVASEHRTVGTLVAARMAGGEVRVNATPHSQCWRNVPIPGGNQRDDASAPLATVEHDGTIRPAITDGGQQQDEPAGPPSSGDRSDHAPRGV